MKYRTKVLYLALLPVSLFAGAKSIASPPAQYRLTDLGTLGGTSSAAFGINASGQVVGFSDIPGDASHHAFLYSAGIMTDLGTLPDGGASEAYGINSSGQVACAAYTSGDATYHAALYSGGSMIDLGALDGNYSGSSGINSSGQIVGTTTTITGQHAFLYSAGIMSDLGALGGDQSFGNGINDSGQVVGEARTSTEAQHAFLYSAGTMTDLGSLAGGDNYSQALGINSIGQIVGESATNSSTESHAFLYSAGSMTDLGTLGGAFSSANSINAYGQIVGISAITGEDFGVHAFLYSDGTMLNLSELLDSSGDGWDLQYATGINDSGWIVGKGSIDGADHAFLLTPVPEPSSLVLAAVGVLGVVVGARRQAASRLRLIVGITTTVVALSVSLAAAPASASTVKTSDGNGADTELRETSGITRGGAMDLNTRSEATPSNMELIALRFDLGGINPVLIDHAQLQSIVDRTGMPANNGLDVYGLNAGTSGQNWTEGTSNGVWNAANPFPGLTYDGSAATFPINPAETTFLGSTSWSAAPSQGSTITFDALKLTSFLRSSGPLATLFVFRDAPTNTQMRLASKETVSLGQTGTGPPVGTGEFAPRLSFDVLPSNSLVVHYTQTGSIDFSLNADSVNLSGVSGNLTLPPEVPILAEITNVEFNVQFGDDGFQSFDISRDLVLNGVHGTLTQSAQLSIGADGDGLSIFNGEHTTFDLGSVGSVEVWPQGGNFGRNVLIGPGTTTGTLLAQFIYHPAAVPEPSSFALAVIGVFGFTAVARGQELLKWS